jgi:hypothetical protein
LSGGLLQPFWSGKPHPEPISLSDSGLALRLQGLQLDGKSAAYCGMFGASSASDCMSISRYSRPRQRRT